jgi:lipoprotein signal peptidase
LAAVDIGAEAVVASPAWADHQRSAAWWILSVATLCQSIWLCLVPSRVVTAGAGLLGGGVLANLVSAQRHDAVLNPFVIEMGNRGVAFNLADIFIVAGITVLVLGLSHIATRSSRPHQGPIAGGFNGSLGSERQVEPKLRARE